MNSFAIAIISLKNFLNSLNKTHLVPCALQEKQPELTGKRLNVTGVEIIKTNVSDRLGKLREASENWKNRVEEKDAAKFTVATKATDVPAQLPFEKSEGRSMVRMASYESTTKRPKTTEKEEEENVVTSSDDSVVKQPPNDSEKRNGKVAPKTVSVQVNEEKLFDSFFAKHEKASAALPADSNMDWDLDVITSTTR